MFDKDNLDREHPDRNHPEYGSAGEDNPGGNRNPGDGSPDRMTLSERVGERVAAVRHRVSSGLEAVGRLEAVGGLRRHLSGLSGRSRRLLVVAVGLAVLGISALAANAATTGGSPPAGEEAIAPPTEQAREEAADRADRAERATQASPAEEPKESPAPSPSEPEPEPEPEPAETEEAEEEEAEEAETQQAAEEEPADWVHPMPGAATTSCYGMRWGVQHAGVDLAAPEGTTIRAAGAGTVTDAGWVFSGYGISVVIDHGDGFYTHYAHMNEAAVGPGQSVSPGQTIGYEGSTGDSTGPHLHFEVHSGMWNQIEPTSWMSDRGVSIGGC